MGVETLACIFQPVCDPSSPSVSLSEHSPSGVLQRRGFVSRIAAAGAAFAALWVPGRAAAQRASVRADTVQGKSPLVRHEQDAWLDALTGLHRQVYDVVTPAGAIGIAFARNFLTANADGYGLADKDVSVVVSLRHSGIAYAFSDPLWAQYGLGEAFEVKDPGGQAPLDHNPQAAMIAALQKRGVVFTVCGMALRRRATEAAQRTGKSPDAVREEWRRGLIPGVVEVVAGVIAVNRAQERGFSYVYAG